MEAIRKINDELAITGQVTSEQLQKIAQEGFKSVLALQLPQTADCQSSEQQQAETLGLYYVSVPFEAIDDEVVIQVLEQINKLPKPALVYCHEAVWASVLVLIYITTQQGATLKQAFEQVERLGLLK